MNSKLSSKPSKKDRPRSSDNKVSKTKRRGDVTPEKSMTPVPSIVGVSDEGQTNQAVANILSTEDIQSLAINVEELEKNRPPKCSLVEKASRQLTVRKTTKMKECALDLKDAKMVTVARPICANSEFDSYERIGDNDPSLDDMTPFFEYHILGSLEEFKEENEKKLNAKKIPLSYNDEKHYPVPNTKTIKGRVFPSSIYKPNMDQSNALNNWERQMSERRKQQGHLARLLNTSTEMLGMNQGEEYRTTQEERHLIDRSIPSKYYGKGYRVGSEFWNQVELIGDDETGIHMTLNQTERGYPPVVEHVGKPVMVKKEMGVDWSNTGSLRNTAIHHPFKKSRYLETRKEELKESISELCPHKPYLQKLEIIGGPLESISSVKNNGSRETTRIDSLSLPIDETLEEDEEENDPLSTHPDIYPEPIFGPSLMIAGHSAQWNGSTHNRLGEVGTCCRVLLEAKVNERVVSTLDVFNDGTAAIYYSWKSVPKVNKLGATLAGNQRRFYFDKNSGVILPGDTLKFPFIFKSTNPGMFSEEWQLDTTPVLTGGAAIRVVLRGLALQDDLNAEKRDSLENELESRQARQIVQTIIEEILNGIRSPERPASPVDAYLTDEECFLRENFEICYNEEVIEELKQLYNDIIPDEDWDFSISSLRQLIMNTECEEEDQRDGYLSRLNQHVKNLAFPQRFPIKQEMYSTCYVMLCELVDDIVTRSDSIRSAMGLPLREMIEDNSMVDDAQDKKAKKSSEGTRLTVEKKDGKKDKKSGERPVSSQRLKTPAEKKSSRGSSRTQLKSSTEENQDENNISAPVTPPEIVFREQPSIVLAESQYKEKNYVQAYTLVAEAVEKIAAMFEDIENSRQ